MAILRGSVAAGTIVQSGYGQALVTFVGGDQYKVNLDTIPGGAGTVTGGFQITAGQVTSFELLGNSFVVTQATGSNDNRLFGNRVLGPATIAGGNVFHIKGGHGKVYISKGNSGAALNELVTVQLENLTLGGIVIDTAANVLTIPAGSVLVAQQGVTGPHTFHFEGGATATNTEVEAGYGLGLLTSDAQITDMISGSLTAQEIQEGELTVDLPGGTDGVTGVTIGGNPVPSGQIRFTTDNGPGVIIEGTAVTGATAGDAWTVTYNGPTGDVESKVIQLDRITFPFTLTANDTLDAIGNSFLLT